MVFMVKQAGSPSGLTHKITCLWLKGIQNASNIHHKKWGYG